MQRVKTTLGNLIRGLQNFRNWSRQQKIIGGLVAVVVIAAIVGLVVWVNRTPKAGPAPKLTVSQAHVSALKSLQAKDYSAAQTALTQDAQNPTDKNNLLLLATVYEAQGKYQQAVTTYKQVQTKYSLDYSLAISLGQAESLVKDKADAVNYYQQAITLMENSKPPIPNLGADVAALQAQIKSLQS